MFFVGVGVVVGFIQVFWDGVRVAGIAGGEGAHGVGGGGGGVVRRGGGFGFGCHVEGVGGRASECSGGFIGTGVCMFWNEA